MNIPALHSELNIAFAITSYQVDRLMLVRSDGESLDVNFKIFQRLMGLVATEDTPFLIILLKLMAILLLVHVVLVQC